jgi:putative ABC transport system permease protein
VQAVPVGAATIYIGTRSDELIDAFNAQVVGSGSLGSVEDPAVVSGSLRAFGAASLIVDEKAAQEDDLVAGQQLAVWGPDGVKRDVAVAAIVRTGLSGDLAYVSSAAVNQQSIERVDIRILPGTTRATAFAALRTALAGQQATLVTTAQAAAALTGSVHDSSSTTTLFVLGVALLYALAAVANTMVMATAGRRRELAALSLVGVTRGQALCCVAAESLVAVVIGTVVAALAGLSVLASQWIALVYMAGTFPVTLPWGPTGTVVAACAVIGVVAAACSAVNAMRGRTVELVAQRE